MDTDTNTNEEMEMEEESMVFEVTEIDYDYEFDAARWFNFTKEKSPLESRLAQIWFETAQSYPPSPKGQSKSSTRSIPRSSTLMKPTASQLAKQDAIDDVVMLLQPSTTKSLNQFNPLKLPPLASYLPSHGSCLSILKAKNIRDIRKDYNAPEFVAMRVPLDTDGPDCNSANEVVIHEAYFALGFCGVVPSLVAEVARFYGISPGQFNPSAWRVLTAIQVFGELHNVTIGVAEVLYVYFFRSWELDSSRHVIQRRSGNPSPLLYDVDSSVSKEISYEKDWQRRFLFMRVGDNPGFPVTWCARDPKVKKNKSGKNNASKVFKYPEERRKVLFLLSSFALEKSFLWGYNMSEFDVSIGDCAMELYRQSVAIVPNQGQTLAPTEEEQLPKALLRCRNATVADGSCPVSRSTKQKKRLIASSPGDGELPVLNHADALSDLNTSLFLHDRKALSDIGYAAILRSSQTQLMKVMSVCTYAKVELDRMSGALRQEKNNNFQLKRELAKETTNHKETTATKDNEISLLKQQFANLTKQVKEKTITLHSLKEDNGRLLKKLKIVVPAATNHCTWNMVQDFKKGNAKNWNAVEAEKNYREVMVKEAEIAGKTIPTFPSSYTYLEDGNSTTADEQ